MSSFKTPDNNRTVSKTGREDDKESTTAVPAAPKPLPTPQSDAKWSFANRHVFMSPTDAITSPCTQQLSHRRFPKKGFRPPTQPPAKKPISKLADKENQRTMEAPKETPAAAPSTETPATS